ncbi:MAG: PQQ-dependent sugar dehydrogenase [Prolixibacteraceae bacterium]|nr:PQQ-dependent sugar dehydrogenase [Prolixibacteraceae bacterium]
MKQLNARILLLVFTFSFFGAKSQTSTKLIQFSSGLVSPVSIANAGDNRLFVAEQRGNIRIVTSAGTVQSTPFLDITGRVVYGGERGLLGLAFHPDYKTNGYFYVNYIGKGDSTYISRFKVSSDANKADAASEFKILTIYQPYQNHNGGDLKFGPDGYLYIGMGDGGSSGDPGNRAQNPKELLGKMLRIDINNGTRYSIPTSNPFATSTTTKPEIWALGLRNPWRFSFDRQTGDLWIADVGQNVVEEVNFQPASSKGGENYGWKCYEGNLVFNTTGCVPASNLTFPVYTYPQNQECSVTGGYVFRGAPTSPYYGSYFFTDYCSDRIWTLKKSGANWIKEDFGQFSGNNFSTFGEDVNGQLYVAGITSGKIYRIFDQVTSIPQAELNDFKIYQIPGTHKIRVETFNEIDNELWIQIYTITGAEQLKILKSGPVFDVNLDALHSGIYLIKITGSGNSQVKKVLLQ